MHFTDDQPINYLMRFLGAIVGGAVGFLILILPAYYFGYYLDTGLIFIGIGVGFGARWMDQTRHLGIMGIALIVYIAYASLSSLFFLRILYNHDTWNPLEIFSYNNSWVFLFVLTLGLCLYVTYFDYMKLAEKNAR